MINGYNQYIIHRNKFDTALVVHHTKKCNFHINLESNHAVSIFRSWLELLVAVITLFIFASHVKIITALVHISQAFSIGHNIYNFYPNLVQYRSRICIKRNHSPGLLR